MNQNVKVLVQTKAGKNSWTLIRQAPHDPKVRVGMKANSLGYPGGVVLEVVLPEDTMD